MVKLAVAVMLSAFVVFGAHPVMAHPGKTDKAGCHKEKKTGKRHCHG